ncbi:hypothetical protein MKMG_00924 [Methanogenium sp. MK-MG]|nr:hypothetical protein MKMG_00924 [Methanogenium sp. MK-MG]
MLALCLVQGAAAADFIETVADVDPSGDFAPGDPVTVHVIVRLTGSGDIGTFNPAEELEAYTELDDPEWDYTILVNKQGIPKQTSSRYLRLLGWDLSYPEENEVLVDYALSGRVPTVAQTSETALFRLRQLDKDGRVWPGNEFLIKPTVINPGEQYITAATSSATIARGDDLSITGTAEENPVAGVALWILGRNCASYATETVDGSGAFEYRFGDTANLAPGQYFVVVQHPMQDGRFDLVPQAGNPAPGQAAVVRPVLDAELTTGGLLPPIFILEGQGSLQGSNAATALINAMNDPEVDDTFYELSFMIQEPWIMINPVGDRYVNETFIISGSTNLAVGDSLCVDVTSLSGALSGSSGTVFIVAGDTDGANTWEFTVDTSAYPPDYYTVTVTGMGTAPMATQTFSILEEQTSYVSITTSGNSPYYIGEEIVFSGTNTDSNTTWLFISGPNLPGKGGLLEDPRNGVNTAAVGNFAFPDGSLDSGEVWTGENVTADNTWEYRWDTSGVNLDAGSYTISAVSTATDQDDLETQDAIYATASITVKQPFITAGISSATVTKGDDLQITGSATGEPAPGVAVWILGKNYVSYVTESVGENSTFGYTFTNTTDLAPGQYFAIVQHPMTNDQFDIAPQINNPAMGQIAVVRPVLDAELATGELLPPVFILEGAGSLQGANAATALVDAMNSADIDDTYYKLTFMVQEPLILINAISDKYVGETFTISGTTNLAVGNNLMVNVAPALNATCPGASGTVPVIAGEIEGANVWEFAVDTSAFTPDDYIVTVESFEAAQTATRTFTVLQADQNHGITITATGNCPYSIGEEIFISGTNTDSDTTWLFVSGSSLPSKGGSIENPNDGVNSATNANGLPVSSFYPDGYLDSDEVWEGVNVAADNTWECRWDTTGADLDAGIYTIYAVTTATDRDDLGSHSASYAIASVTLKKPYLTAMISSSVVAKGDDLSITGNTSNYLTQDIALWIFSKNYVFQTTQTVGENGVFTYTLANTTNLAAGQYFVLVQHPMDNDQFDLTPQADNPAAGQTAVVRPVLDAEYANPNTGLLPPVFLIEGPGSLQGSDAYTALVNAMNNPEIDDTCFRLTFMVEEPWIMIDAIGDRYAGDIFHLTGTTNLAVGDRLIVDVTSSSFRPTETTPASEFIGSSGTVFVTAGENEGVNVWDFTVNTSSFIPDEYIVRVEGIVPDQTATRIFNVLPAAPNPDPTPQPTYDVTCSFSPGWNLISTPVDTPAITTSGFLYETAYAYNTTTGTYETVPLADIVPGEGYWVGAFTGGEITFTGVPLTEYQKNLSTGWNLIGGVGIATQTGNIRANHGAAHSGQTYRYSTEGHVYSQASLLEPGVGYWISSAAPCNICVNITPPVTPA